MTKNYNILTLFSILILFTHTIHIVLSLPLPLTDINKQSDNANKIRKNNNKNKRNLDIIELEVDVTSNNKRSLASLKESDNSVSPYEPVLRQLGGKKGYFPDYPTKGHNKHGHGKGGFFGMYPQTPSVPQFVPVPVEIPSNDAPQAPVQQPPANNRGNPGDFIARPYPEYRKDEYVVTKPAEYDCPNGYGLVGNTCTKQEQLPSKLGCKEGWRFQDGVCFGVDTVQPDYMCPNGYEDKNNECVKTITAPQQMLCPKGYVLGKEGCVENITTHVDYVCDDTFMYVSSKHLCVKSTEAQPNLDCPAGMQYVDGMCRRDIVEAGTPACPKGFDLLNGECLSHHEEPADLGCPDGFHLHGTECISERKATSSYICPQGSVLNGDKCITRNAIPASFECPPNSNLNVHSNVCEQFSSLPAQLTCPHYYSFDKISNQCVKGKYNTKKHSKKDSHGHDKHSYSINAEYNCPASHTLNAHTHMCEMQSSNNPVPTCLTGYTYDGFECYKEICVQSDVHCPGGFELRGDMCVSVEILNALPQCTQHDQVLNNGYCVSTKRAPMKLMCPNGYNPSKNGCQKVEVVKPAIICPPGTSLADTHTHSSQTHGHAHSIVNIRRLIGISDQICLGQVERAPLEVCPEGFDLSSIEYTNANNGVRMCMGIRHGPPKFVCENGFSEIDGQCIKYDYGSKRPLCPEFYKFSYGQCIKNLDERPVVLCPIGFKLYSSICVSEVNTEPIPICPQNYNFDKLTGKCYKVEVQYDFADERPEKEDEALLDLSQKPQEPEEEDILDLTQKTTPAPSEAMLPMQQPMQAPPPPPPQVTIIQRPVPIPQPMVMLPPQRPMMPPPPPPMPQVVPVPVPFMQPQKTHHTKEIHKELVPVHHTKVIKVPVKQKQKHGKKHHHYY